MSARASRLSLAGFRGATKPLVLDFDVNKPVVVIFGENGTGKSTIVDAIDFVTNGGLGSFLGRQSTPAKQYLPALSAPPGTLAVELVVGGNTWKATLAGNRASLAPPDTARPVVHVLRRTQILALLMAEPSRRYEQLARFIAVPGVEAAEDALRTAVKDTGKELEAATAAIARSQEQLEGYWEAEGRPGAGALAWARELAARDAQVLEKAAGEADQLLERLARAARERDRAGAALQALSDAGKEAGEATARLRAAERQSAAAEASLLELLEKAESYVTGHPSLATCPVCEQTIDNAALLAGLRRRREAGSAVDQARVGVESAARREVGARTTWEAAQDGLWEAGASLLAAARTTRLKTVVALGINWTGFGTLEKPRAPGESEAAAREAVALVAALDPAVARLRDASARARADVVRMRAAREWVKSLDESLVAAKEAEQLLARLTRAQGIVESRRKGFVDGILADISGRVSELYAKIHPGEEIGDITLATDPNPKKRASLDLRGRFNEVCDVPPEGYYSESHLDTLGICVFMALAERSRASDRPNLLVLDDVLTSVDGPHMERFVSLVYDEASEFAQVVLTTHYRHWFETYRGGHGAAANACLIELEPWSIGAGIRVATPAPPAASGAAMAAG